ncbi:DUF6660 family protein [Runella slithyformis]|uniref:Uncharacterized protein n=1 Tax=Runella slithyformis (strain ATCC 29530 / DSM 19594 / LMG 11500 / NCIMB 11436 / LSU 4) TaxID=761193 RepID=A0A7U4E965_RUNSL|nr:hypothetical protein Runsl_5928 [Runella slithyformis DSM 19594]
MRRLCGLNNSELSFYNSETLLHNILAYICRVKILAVILSMYLLVLSGLPCRDGEDCNALNNGKISSSKTNHTDHHSDTKSCSPFCTCCGSVISLGFHSPVSVPDNQTSFFTQKVKIAFYNDSFFSNFYGNIWQPPKI